jgi:hypothetical protein
MEVVASALNAEIEDVPQLKRDLELVQACVVNQIDRITSRF